MPDPSDPSDPLATTPEAVARGVQDHRLHVGGAWCDPLQPAAPLLRYHPADGRLVARYAAGGAVDVAVAVTAARQALAGTWQELSSAQRSELLLTCAQALRAQLPRLAQCEADETGKPLADAQSDILGGIALWRHAAAAARCQHGQWHGALSDGLEALTFSQPVGVVGLITPWNFPFIVAAERLPFMLAAGCTVVCKPSEHASGTALLMAEILVDAGLPAGVFNVVSGLGETAGAALVAHPDVAMISFTGSTANGRRVMAAAAPGLKRLSLELGGKSPVLVFDDADLPRAVDAVISGFTHNAGQCCIATSRLLVQGGVREQFLALLRARLAVRWPAGALQPLANRQQFDRVSQMQRLGAATGRLVAGCVSSSAPASAQGGWFVPPSVFDDLPAESPLWQQEIFGPVLAVRSFADEAQAIEMANDTEFGLAAAIWTADRARAMRCARAIRAGRLWINSAQDNFPELPVGGMGASGMGREAGSSGIATYSDIKTVIMH